MQKIKIGKVFKFHGEDVKIVSINADGTASLSYAGKGKSGFAGKVVLDTKKTPDKFNLPVDAGVDSDEVSTLNTYFTPDSLDGTENEQVVVSYIRSEKPLTEEEKVQFLSSKDKHIRRMMGMRQDLTEAQYEQLVNDKEAWSRGLVAYNSNITEAQVRKLSKDKEPMIREAIAWRKDTPSDVLDLLSKDRSIEVRIRAARNSNLSSEGQHKLTFDRSPRVRAALVENKNLDSKFLNVLKLDTDRHVIEAFSKP